MSLTKWIGITGNIASGKSTVSQILSEHGYPVLDADQITHEVYRTETPENKETRKKIESLFGTLETTKIRKLVFENIEKRKSLEAILHPYIRAQSLLWLNKQKSLNNPFAFYEASLLIEAGIPKEMFGVLLITAKSAVRKNRLKSRNPNLSDSEVEKIMNSQASEDEKRKHATWCIENNSDNTHELAAKVSDWLSLLKS